MTEGADESGRDPPVTSGSESGDGAGDEAASEGSESAETGETEESAETAETEESAETAESDESSATGDAPESTDAERSAASDPEQATADQAADLPPDVRKYDRFKKIDGSTYERTNEFLRDRTYITAREWAIARLCADFRTETGVEMTKIGKNLPELVPFMTDTYTPQAVNQARYAFEEKVRKAGSTFLYGAMCDFFTAEELDDVMYEATEVAKFLLEVEGIDLAVEEELAAEDRISSVMRDVRESSAALRHDEVTCPHCEHTFEAEGHASE